MQMRVVPGAGRGYCSGMSDVSQPATLIRFFWSERCSFLPGLLLAIGRIVVIAPIPLIFRHVIDHQMPAKDLRGILWMSLLTCVLLVAHQWFSVRGASKLGEAVTGVVLRLRSKIFDKIQ